MREATKNLAARTRNLALATTSEGDMYSAGTCHILEMPEFYDIDVTRNLLSLLDQSEYFQHLLEKVIDDNDIQIFVGDDLGADTYASYGFVFSPFKTADNHKG